MADLFAVITDKAVLDKSEIEQWNEGVIISAIESANFLPGSPLISQPLVGNYSVGTFVKFANTSNATTPLTDGEELTSTAITDAEVNLTILEYGHDITVTALGQNSSGARAFSGAQVLIGNNLRNTVDSLAIQALEGTANEITVNATNEATTLATDILTPAFVQKAYNKLRRANIPPISGGNYIAICHPDVMYDLKAGTAANTWTQVLQYSQPEIVLNNEVGMYGGFRFIESSNVTINADAGGGNVDTYHTSFIGYNALGMAMSAQFPIRTYMNDRTSKIPGRFTHLGWHGLFVFDTVDDNACWLVTSASTVGSNA
jgi:N4-gp56 family major capsid protein